MAQAALPATPDNATVVSAEPFASANFGGWSARARAFLAQPAVRRTVPALLALGGIALALAAYFTIASGPDRLLYADLSDGERAEVTAALEKAGIDYRIDNATGAISVAESDIYRARMVVASDGSLAAPQDAAQMLDSIPLGSSRTLEGERLKLARERELVLTILEIDGIEAARVHLATPQKSVFLRDSNPPSASVMVRVKRGRELTPDQVEAVVNIVAGSVPGLDPDSVRVADQNGRLLTAKNDPDHQLLQLQSEMESKLRDQIAQLLTPMLGAGNFTTEVQVELSKDEVTSARESFDKEGALRSESQSNAVRRAAGTAGGVPGALSNTPPPPGELADAPPRAGVAEPQKGAEPVDSESSAQRNFELGRQVEVTTRNAGEIKRITVAVALDAAAMKNIAPVDEEKIRALVASAVGAKEERGDSVTVVASKFEKPPVEQLAFYETDWFWQAARAGGALLALVLVLLFAVRPMLKRLKPVGALAEDSSQDGAEETSGDDGSSPLSGPALSADGTALGARADLPEQIDLARKLAQAQPERAAAALQRLLAQSESEAR